ncbi:glycosyltransferase family 87 protein [Tuwongella immobilis]|uniref:DUF2029 domain-containing protein n=1 Tax=Tuwongella immobilis TaxID=692036 RepID=A0A6C2YVK6_9BACT|nr:glycosyltransferase family 87 protein [Tuwongella immobilis]VIP05474.1 duf2029 domain containing protein : Uncharacterized protein OS=Singulisphaera acidiphila (strain ATCC BAA-1392 / DSM 18658 / VKM B-2454 / MOB10) GN=Sinac_3002 PE=4 SV=1: DUF2029 [Tuwongella immobilis]VTS08304.1 duf2029 domain containing protein : Uncharacterized protein OS=Singulisphaera acidiphila (strain ATCC BAA-1392 / DSM 18658 / VKM B-2454 / MOB10) GN=Sinac_3002 PE=4 SV=1: DUF2029 [Tuwongella immobilis]
MQSFLSSFDSPRAQRWFLFGLIGLFLVISVQYSLKVLKPRADGHTRSAILRWTPQLQALEAGENINERYNYPNPPIMAILLWPFTKLPLMGTALSWFYLKVLLTFLAVRWSFAMIETPTHPFPAWAKALTMILALRPILSDLSHGNVNLLILFLCIASLYAFSCGRDILSGVIMALAIACKLTPAMFIGYFVWKRAWRALAGTVLGLVLFFLVVPSAVLGVERNWELLNSWVDVMVKPFVVDGIITTEHPNQSIPGVLNRLLTHSPSHSDYINDAYVPLEYHNVADLAPKTVRRIVQGCMLLFAILFIVTARQSVGAGSRIERQSQRAGWPLAAEFSIILIGMLLFSERTWKHHCVTLLLPYAVLCYAFAVIPMQTWLRNGIIGTLVFSMLAMASTSSGLFGDRSAEMAQVYGGFTLALLALLSALFALLAQQTKLRVAMESATPNGVSHPESPATTLAR